MAKKAAPAKPAKKAAPKAAVAPKAAPAKAPAAPRKKRVTLTFPGVEANKVVVAGGFNDWSEEGLPLKIGQSGEWALTLTLAPGRYEYKFLVDGQWQTDPRAEHCGPNEYGAYNNVLVVG